jgi:hypothetical protein
LIVAIVAPFWPGRVFLDGRPQNRGQDHHDSQNVSLL